MLTRRQASKANSASICLEPTRPNPPLPQSVHSIILSHVPRHDLTRCCLVSTSFYALARKELYRSVRITRWQHEEGRHLGGSAMRDRRREDDGRIFQTLSRETQSHIKTLAVYHHSGVWCKPTPEGSVSLPNLRVVRLESNNRDNLHYNEEDGECDFLKGLSPSKIVVGNASLCSVLLSDRGLGIPRQLLQNANDITFVCREKFSFSSYVPIPTSSTEAPLATRLIWVFLSNGPQTIWLPRNYRDRTWSYRWMEFDLNPLAQAIANHPNAQIVFVNTERVDDRLFQGEDPTDAGRLWAFDDRLSSELNVEMRKVRKYVRTSAIQRRIESICYMTMNDYLQNEDWSDAFEYYEVAPWLETDE